MSPPPDHSVIKDPQEPLSPAGERAFFTAYFREYFCAWTFPYSPITTNTRHDNNFNIILHAAPFYHPSSDRLSAFDIFPPLEGFQGWPAYSAGLSQLMAGMAAFHARPDLDSLRYGRKGDVVWMSMLFVAGGKRKEDGGGGEVIEDVPARTTLVLEMVNEIEGPRWLIVQEHISTTLGGG